MNPSRQEPHRLSYSSLVGTLGLILLSALAAHAQQPPARPEPVIWRFTLVEGTEGPGEIGLSSPCVAKFDLKMSVNKFIRLGRSGSVVLNPTRTAIALKLDATKLPPGEYSDQIRLRCLDCERKPSCHQVNFASLLVLTVTPRPRAGSETNIPAAQLKAAIDAALAALEEEFGRRVGRLEEIEGRTEEGKNVNGYDAGEVRELISWLKRQLVALFEREGLYAMRDYIEKTYQPSPLEVVRAVTRNARLVPPSGVGFPTTALSFRPGGARPAERLIATSASSGKAFKYAHGFIRSTMKNSGPIKLFVRSEPDLANVVLETRRGGKASFSTNNDLSDFWPGLYSLTVTKDGFVPIVQGEVDLVLNDTIECTLVKTGEAILCRIK